MAFLGLDLDALVSLAERHHQSLIVVLAEVCRDPCLFEAIDLLQLALYLSPRHVLLGRSPGDPDDNAFGLRKELFLIGRFADLAGRAERVFFRRRADAWRGACRSRGRFA